MKRVLGCRPAGAKIFNRPLILGKSVNDTDATKAAVCVYDVVLTIHRPPCTMFLATVRSDR